MADGCLDFLCVCVCVTVRMQQIFEIRITKCNVSLWDVHARTNTCLDDVRRHRMIQRYLYI